MCILAARLDWSVMKLATGKIGDQVELVGMGILTGFSRLSLSWRGVGVIVLGILLARWTWILFAPDTIAVLPAKPDTVGNSAEALFGLSASGVAMPNGDAELGNVHLVGVFTGSKAFAVFKIDDKTQHGAALGEDIIKGTKLIEVGADYVLLQHNGLSQRVNLENKSNNKDRLALEHPSPVSGVDQAVAGWNQANQEMQNKQKIPNAHRH